MRLKDDASLAVPDLASAREGVVMLRVIIVSTLAVLRRRKDRAHLLGLRLGSHGGLMLEAVVAMAVFALVGVAVLVGLSTTHTSGATVEGHSIAENLGRNQVEYIFSIPYQDPPSFYPTVVAPIGYGITAAAEEFVQNETAVQKIVVTVDHGGETVLVLETLRAK